VVKAEVLWDPAALDTHGPAWSALFRSGAHQPSVSFGWTRALFRNHVKPRDRVALVVLRDGEDVCGLVPLVVESETLLGVPLASLTPLADRYNTHGDLLLRSTEPDVVGAFVEALLALKCRWDVFRMGRLLEADPLVESLEHELRKRRVSFRPRVEPPSFVLRLPESFDAYLRGRSAKFRNFLRRAEKKLAAAGRVEFRLAGRDIEVEAAYRALLEIEERSWKHGHGTAISAIARQRGFYGDLCRGMAATGHLHLSLLFVGERPVAHNLGLVFGDTYYYLKTSFDEGFRACSPATVARARLLEETIARRLATFDFPAEPYEWEAQWATELRWHRSLLVFNRGARAGMFNVAQRLRDAWRRRPGQRSVRYLDPRSLR
jgi:CelD/BcsL family acetyltransferase involved in cellulose biosynthesis